MSQLEESYPPLPITVPVARRALSAYAASVGATPEKLEAIEMATSEALTNAVVHAYGDGWGTYRDGGGHIHVSAGVSAGELRILIADDGRGMQARATRPGLGVGLAVIAHVADAFTMTQRSTGGTELEMRFTLGAGALADGHPPRNSAVAPA